MHKTIKKNTTSKTAPNRKNIIPECELARMKVGIRYQDRHDSSLGTVSNAIMKVMGVCDNEIYKELMKYPLETMSEPFSECARRACLEFMAVVDKGKGENRKLCEFLGCKHEEDEHQDTPSPYRRIQNVYDFPLWIAFVNSGKSINNRDAKIPSRVVAALDIDMEWMTNNIISDGNAIYHVYAFPSRKTAEDWVEKCPLNKK